MFGPVGSKNGLCGFVVLFGSEWVGFGWLGVVLFGSMGVRLVLEMFGSVRLQEFGWVKFGSWVGLGWVGLG